MSDQKTCSTMETFVIRYCHHATSETTKRAMAVGAALELIRTQLLKGANVTTELNSLSNYADLIEAAMQPDK